MCRGLVIVHIIHSVNVHACVLFYNFYNYPYLNCVTYYTCTFEHVRTCIQLMYDATHISIFIL